ncbi:MAG TPA: glycosyltransferase family 4 protein [Clostridiaceae bacterium]|nr:glycosyltransferase family 4 protein [Clostridiaceae bacterium]
MKKLDWMIMKKTLGAIDGFVLITKQMNEIINKSGKPFVVIEGIISKEEYEGKRVIRGDIKPEGKRIARDETTLESNRVARDNTTIEVNTEAIDNTTIEDKIETKDYTTIENKEEKIVTTDNAVNVVTENEGGAKTDIPIENDDISIERDDISIENDKPMKTIVYTGKTNKEFGILELIEAFLLLNDADAHLHIYGGGNADKEIKQFAKENKKIKFFGTVDRETVLARQREAFVLVNPRSYKNEFTKYSFPSKTLEYLLAARPVVMHKLEGIPDDYNDFLFYFDSDNPGDMAKKLQEILTMDADFLEKIGKTGCQYVLEHKNEEKQGQVLIDLLNRI